MIYCECSNCMFNADEDCCAENVEINADWECLSYVCDEGEDDDS